MTESNSRISRAGPPTERIEAGKDRSVMPYYAAEERYTAALAAIRCSEKDPTHEQWREFDCAKMLLMTSEAPGLWAVLRKLAIIEAEIIDIRETGSEYGCCELVFLGAIKSDLLAIGAREDERRYNVR